MAYDATQVLGDDLSTLPLDGLGEDLDAEPAADAAAAPQVGHPPQAAHPLARYLPTHSLMHTVLLLQVGELLYHTREGEQRHPLHAGGSPLILATSPACPAICTIWAVMSTLLDVLSEGPE
jgi:hypothetical protein